MRPARASLVSAGASTKMRSKPSSPSLKWVNTVECGRPSAVLPMRDPTTEPSPNHACANATALGSLGSVISMPKWTAATVLPGRLRNQSVPVTTCEANSGDVAPQPAWGGIA